MGATGFGGVAGQVVMGVRVRGRDRIPSTNIGGHKMHLRVWDDVETKVYKM